MSTSAVNTRDTRLVSIISSAHEAERRADHAHQIQLRVSSSSSDHSTTTTTGPLKKTNGVSETLAEPETRQVLPKMHLLLLFLLFYIFNEVWAQSQTLKV